MSSSDTYWKIQHAVPDILRRLSELYVQGRGSPTPSSSASVKDLQSETNALLRGTVGSSLFSSTGGQDMKSLTGVRPAFKPFVIGFIPPDIRLTFIPVERSNVPLNTTGTSIESTAAISTEGVKAAHGLPDSFYRKLTDVAKTIGCSPADLLLVLWQESGLRSNNDNHVDGDPSKPVQARGLNQITPAAVSSSGMTMDYWENHYSKLSAEEQLPFVQSYFQSVHKGTYENVAQLRLANFAPARIDRAADPNAVVYAKNNADGSVNNHWRQNKGLNPNGDITVSNMITSIQKGLSNPGYLSQLARLKSVVGEDVAVAKPTGTADSNTITGAGNKAVSAIMTTGNIYSTDPDDPLYVTGRNIVISDKRQKVVNDQLAELQKQIDSANTIPSMLMLINPDEFTRNYEHQIDTPKGRRGPIVHMWLEKPLSISSKGVTAAQYAFGPTDNSTNPDFSSQGGGLTHIHRLHSLSYANFMSLILMYRNNGHLYTQAVTGDTQNWGIPVISMSVFLYYDGHIYIGSFDDFSVTDDAEKPFHFSYNWKFTARYDFDVTEIDDQIVSSYTNVQYGATAFPRELTKSQAIDQGTAVPSDEVGPTPSAFPTFPQDTAPTGTAPDTANLTTISGGTVLV